MKSGTKTEPAAPTATCEVGSVLTGVRDEMNRGQLYRARRSLGESPRCVFDDADVQHLELELYWELRDLPELSRLSARLLEARPGDPAGREAQDRVKSYRSAAGLGGAQRAEHERLLEALAKANAEQDPRALALFEEARALGESGELLFEGGMAARQAGRSAEARRLWDAATTLLEVECQAAPEALKHEEKARWATLWAGDARLWFKDLLYDLVRRRFVAYAPRSSNPLAKRLDVFAAADDWVFFDGELWNVASGRKVAEIEAQAAVSSPSGQDLFLLSGADVIKVAPFEGTLVARLGQLDRIAASMHHPARLTVTPSESYMAAYAWLKEVILDLKAKRPVMDVETFDFVALDGDWMALAHEWGVEALHVPTKKKLSYRWRQPPFAGGLFSVSRNARRFMIFEPVAEETVVFEAPRATARALEPLSRVKMTEALPTLFSPDGSRIAARCEEEGGLDTCFIDPVSGKRTGSVSLPASVELCRFGLRVYPKELCEPRLEESAKR